MGNVWQAARRSEQQRLSSVELRPHTNLGPGSVQSHRPIPPRQPGFVDDDRVGGHGHAVFKHDRTIGGTVRLTQLIAIALLVYFSYGCGTVKVYQRGNLGDPIMERQDVFAKQTLEQKFFSTREGSIGGASGIGGGCGCAK